MRHETSAKLCTRPSLIVHVKERAHIATMADVVGGIRCLTAVLLSRSTERLATSQARAQRGWALAQQRKRAPKHKSIDFRKHLLRHECESEPGFVCTCKTYHRSRQRCTHLLNTTQYFHFPRSRRKEVRKSRGESTHPKTQQLHVLPQSIQPLTSGKATFIKNLSDRKRNVPSINKKQENKRMQPH